MERHREDPLANRGREHPGPMAMGRLLCGKEIHLSLDVKHHLWMKQQLPKWRLAMVERKSTVWFRSPSKYIALMLARLGAYNRRFQDTCNNHADLVPPGGLCERRLRHFPTVPAHASPLRNGRKYCSAMCTARSSSTLICSEQS